MKPFALPSKKGAVHVWGFILLVFLLRPPLFGAGVTVRFSGEPAGEGGR